MSKKTQLVFLCSLSLGLIVQNAIGSWLRHAELSQVQVEDSKGHPHDPKEFQVLSFGQLPSVIDWRWLKVLMTAPLSQRREKERSQLYFDVNLVVDLDPHFRDAYVHGAHLVSLLYFDSEGAIEILKRALAQQEKLGINQESTQFMQAWGNEWEIPLLLGYFYFFELDSIAHASRYFDLAGKVKDSPRFVKSLSAKLAKPLGRYEVGLSVLSFLIQSAQTEKFKDELEKKRGHLERAYYMAKLNLEFSQFLEKTKLSRQEAWVRDKTLRIDPWGGQLFLDGQGRIRTETPYENVLGLE